MPRFTTPFSSPEIKPSIKPEHTSPTKQSPHKSKPYGKPSPAGKRTAGTFSEEAKADIQALFQKKAAELQISLEEKRELAERHGLKDKQVYDYWLRSCRTKASI